ncbi:Fic family protein [Pectobacterium actinidiae]|uniref:Fic family protein n=1 Tax=Pectobacterium actinidiae TaxID=1507808 RepID=UPI00381F597E
MENYIVDGNIIRVHQCLYPSLHNISEESHQKIQEGMFKLRLGKNKNGCYEIFLENVNKHIDNNKLDVLQHRLSSYIDKSIISSDRKYSVDEVNIYKYQNCELRSILYNDENFLSFIESVGGYFRTQENKIRTKNIRTVPEPDGSYTEYINATMVINELSKLRQFIKTNQTVNPLFCAIVASVSILCIHPLADGNGRLSRFIFNLILERSSNNYIPLTELCHAARSGYVLSMREAMLFSEWDSAVHFYCACLSLAIGWSELSSM